MAKLEGFICPSITCNGRLERRSDSHFLICSKCGLEVKDDASDWKRKAEHLYTEASIDALVATVEILI